MAIWDRLDEASCSEALPMDAEVYNELDRRWDTHLQNPTTAVPWEQVCGLLDQD